MKVKITYKPALNYHSGYMSTTRNKKIQECLDLLDIHYRSFQDVAKYAQKYGHPHPCDTRAWSQILVSALTGTPGLNRRKGADLDDGSDVKGANTWGAIDTPRFNGVIKAGTRSETAGRLQSLNGMPFLYFVLWDNEPDTIKERCRIWVVRTQKDKAFRNMCAEWYAKRDRGEITSNNFQLHPPRNKNSNEIRNTCGNFLYPLLFCAIREESGFKLVEYNEDVLTSGKCISH